MIELADKVWLVPGSTLFRLSVVQLVQATKYYIVKVSNVKILRSWINTK